VSYLTARSPRSLIAAAWKTETENWWDNRRAEFALYISEVVIEEAGKGDAGAASRRLAALEGLEVLSLNDEAVALAKALIEKRAVPERALDDALHIAIASVNSLEFLLTWNCRHIDNAEIKPKLRSVIESCGFRCPEIATPIELMGGIENE